MVRVYVQDCCIVAKYEDGWNWVNKKLNKQIHKSSKKTYKDFLEIAGRVYFRNIGRGKNTFTLASLEKELKESKINAGDKINSLNKWLAKECPKNKFFEKNGEEYTLLIFSVEGPRDRDILKFYPKRHEKTVAQLVLYHKREIGEKLEDKIEDGFNRLFNEIAKGKPRTVFGRKNNYKECTKLILGATKRLYIIERTPILLFGPRDYEYEKNFFEAINNWINKTIDDDQKECIFLFSAHETKEIIGREAASEFFYANPDYDHDISFCTPFPKTENSNNETLKGGGIVWALRVSGEHKKHIKITIANRLNKILTNLKKYKEIEKKTGGRVSITTTNEYFGSFVLADDNFVHLSKTPSTEDAVGTYYKIEEGDNALLEIIRKIRRRIKNYDEISREISPMVPGKKVNIEEDDPGIF